MNKYFKHIADNLLNKNSSDNELAAHIVAQKYMPVIWLLGKTGAGKTSLIQCLTGLSTAEVGNGFEPCTRSTFEFEFPVEDPLIRFLDTRGLDEATYNATTDLKECQNRSHVLVVVARIDDPVQHTVAYALKNIKKDSPKTPVIIVHTGADTIEDSSARERARWANHQLFESAFGRTLTYVETAIPHSRISPTAAGIDKLLSSLSIVMPEAAYLLLNDEHGDQEIHAYQHMRSQILAYACAAGAADVTPAIGAVAVPSIQAALFKKLGNHYDVVWTRRRLTDYSLALGAGVLMRFGGSYLARQAAKFIPVYGQTLGALAAGTISFATTFALGRSCAYYLFQIQHKKHINKAELRAVYKSAFHQAISEKKMLNVQSTNNNQINPDT